MGVGLPPLHSELFAPNAHAALFLSAATVVGSNFTLAIQPWQTYLFFLLISTIAIVLNIFGYRILGKWNEGARTSPDPRSHPEGQC